MAKSGAQRQAEWRAREVAKIAAQARELEALRTRPAAASGEAGGAETTPGVLAAALDGIRCLLAAQNERLTQLERWERDPLILRQLTEIRRALGLTELHRPMGGHTQRRPLGTS